MAPNGQRRQVNRNIQNEQESEANEDFLRWLQQLVIEQSTASNSNNSNGDYSDGESDLALQADLPPVELPQPQVWQDLGAGFQILLDFMPEDHERYFVHNLRELVEGVEQTDAWPEPTQQLSDLHEWQMAKDFYARAFLYHGENLTPQEIDAVIHDFIHFFNVTRRNRSMRWQKLPAVLWSKQCPDHVEFQHQV